jgi:HAD superfamily hydrolase (TIGR01549 family)
MGIKNAPNERCQTIVFDLDGTLIDSSVTNLKAFQYALSPYGIEITTTDVERMRNLSDKDLFASYLNPIEAKKALANLRDYSHHSAGDTILLEGVKSILNKIANFNIKLGLWTSRDDASAVSILTAHGIKDYFKEVVGGCNVEKNKPHAEGLLLLADKLQAPPETLIHVGDHEHDLIGGTSAGAKVVHAKWCNNNGSAEHPLAHCTFYSIDEFSLWLDKEVMAGAIETVSIASPVQSIE